MMRGKNDGPAKQRKVEKKTVKDDNFDDCQLCSEAFNDTAKRPRSLPCGHTFCSLCLDLLHVQSHVTCPISICGHRYPVPEAGHFPINYALEDALQRRLRENETRFYRNTEESPPAATSPSLQWAGIRKTLMFRIIIGISICACLIVLLYSFAGRRTLSWSANLDSVKERVVSETVEGVSFPNLPSLLQEHDTKVLAALNDYKRILSELDQYYSTLGGWQDQQQQLEDKLLAIINNSKKARLILQEEKSQVVTKKAEVQQGEQRLHAVLDTLRKVTTEHEAHAVLLNVLHLIHEGKQRVEECRQMFPNKKTVITARTMRLVSRKTLKEGEALLKALKEVDFSDIIATEPAIHQDMGSTITNRLQTLMPPNLKAKDIHKRTQPARVLLEAGMVFAVHTVEGRTQYSRMSLDNGSLYLHSLQDMSPPFNAAILQVDELVPAAPPCMVFLDLAWPGSAPRRVFINLTHDTPMGRQFTLLCTGQRGPSYVNTKFFAVKKKGQEGERILSGDYQYNNGTGGVALLPHLDNGQYRRSDQAGALARVWRRFEFSEWNAQFVILTRNCESFYGTFLGILCMRDVFGEVVDGLEVVAEAAQHSPITEVTVVDCGVVLWT